MANYRKLIKRFWTDPRTLDLTDRQCRVFTYLVTGPEACSRTNTGIYEIHRSTFQNTPFRYSLDEVDEVLNFFNEKKSALLKYDAENHIVFIKSFFKHNSTYKTGLAPIMHDFEDTFHKAPEYWAEFGERYRPTLFKMLEKLAANEKIPEKEKAEQLAFVERLVNLKNEINDLQIPNTKIGVTFCSKAQNLEYKKSH